MNPTDPTDSALAAIASLFDDRDAPPNKSAAHGTERFDEAVPPVLSDRVPSADISAAALGTMAVPAATPKNTVEEHPVPATEPEAIDVDTYSRTGPGPLDAIRFRWTARKTDEGNYFVDETIGSTSRPMSLGPMPRSEVIDFIDSRERAARERFEALKSKMTLHRPD